MQSVIAKQAVGGARRAASVRFAGRTVGRWLAGAAGLLWAAAVCTGAEPMRLHPKNPHYLLFRGKPTVLITSGEHYGAVLNRDFDYRKYLRTLEKLGFNLTRTFSGAYCEPPGAFRIRDNTLAPKAGRLICPWARSDEAGYTGGGRKFDLSRWDPAYFRRLRDFVAEAGKRGVVVELVLFCPFYKDAMWALSPMNAVNNVNSIGQMKRTEVYQLRNTADHKKLLAAQNAMVRKIVAELNAFDNLYYEICNEPYFGGVTLQWQRHVAETIAAAEAKLPNRHLIAQNIANGSKKITQPDPRVSIFNFHYAAPPKTVGINYGLNKVIGDDETGFRGSKPGPYRMEGWDFLLAGGGIYSNLDYSFTCGHEDGTARISAPGGGGAVLHKQLGILREFLNGFDFVRMAPSSSVIRGRLPKGVTTRTLVEVGRAYAVYVRGGSQVDLAADLPAGSYRAEWVSTKTGRVEKSERFDHRGGARKLASPKYAEDIALRIRRGK